MKNNNKKFGYIHVSSSVGSLTVDIMKNETESGDTTAINIGTPSSKRLLNSATSRGDGNSSL